MLHWCRFPYPRPWHVCRGVAADAFQLHEDTLLVLVLHHYSLHAGEGTVGDNHPVAFNELRDLRLVDNDVLVARLHDDLETLHLPVRDGQEVVSSGLVGGEVVVIGRQPWNQRLVVQQCAEIAEGGPHKQQSLVQGFLLDERGGVVGVIVGIFYAILHRKVGLEIVVVEGDNFVIHFFRAMIGGSYRKPVKDIRFQDIPYRLPSFGFFRTEMHRFFSFCIDSHAVMLSGRIVFQCFHCFLAVYITANFQWKTPLFIAVAKVHKIL